MDLDIASALLEEVEHRPRRPRRWVRSLAEGRRLRAYLATGTYRDELAEARWVG